MNQRLLKWMIVTSPKGPQPYGGGGAAVLFGTGSGGEGGGGG